MKYVSALFVATAVLILLTCPPLHAAEERRPNVVLFMVDDMGWMDSGVYGSKYYETPHIDAFAERAKRFTNAYAQPLCSPSRASILTGKYTPRHGITTASGHRPPQPEGHDFLPDEASANQRMLLPESRNYLELKEFTLAEALKEAGYRTGHIGKWHIGSYPQHWPEKQGFDVAFHSHPDPGPPGEYFSPYGVRVEEAPPRGRERTGTITDGPDGEYIVDRLADEAIAFIEASRDQPFFLNFWQYGVHGPWGHKEEYTREFAKKKDPRGEQGNPIMASMLKSVDESFGRVLETLDRLNLTDNTIIIFYSDNGGNTHSNTPDDLKRKKGNPEFVADWQKWAGEKPPTNNAPLRDGKGTLYEGGTRVPMMWAWQGHIEPATVSNEIVGHIDIYPTLLDLAGLPRPEQQDFDGISIAKVLTDGEPLEREAFFNYHPHAGNGRAGGVWVRSGDWKLIRWFGFPPGDSQRYELYNLAEDGGESNNLASSNPDNVKELDAMIDGFLEETGALFPRPNPAWKAPSDPAVWAPGRDATAEFEDGVATVTSQTNRPTLQLVKTPEDAGSGTFVVKFRLRTKDGQNALLLWGTEIEPRFTADRRQPFNPARNGDWEEIAVTFSTGEDALSGLRIDASLKPATIEFDWIRLEREDGTPIAEWKF